MAEITGKFIPLTQGKFAIVDSEDYEKLNKWKWHYSSHGYARRFQHISWDNINKIQKGTQLFMHRLILNAPKGKDVDHINGDRLNNQKSNLRICNRSETCQNRGIRRDNKVGIKGVKKSGNKWEAYIKVNQKTKSLGVFIDKLDASKTYNEGAKKYFGEFARLNQI